MSRSFIGEMNVVAISGKCDVKRIGESETRNDVDVELSRERVFDSVCENGECCGVSGD